MQSRTNGGAVAALEAAPLSRARRDEAESLASTATTSLHDDHYSAHFLSHATATRRERASPPASIQRPHGSDGGGVRGIGAEESDANTRSSTPSSARGGGTRGGGTSTSLHSSSSSLPAPSDDRMSINPACEIAHILTTSLADSHPYSYSPETLSSASSSFSAAQTRSRTDSHQARRALFNMAGMDGALPADDGMHSLRQKLQEVKQLAVSTEEKAKRMHFLMTQDYMKHRALLTPEPETHQHGAHPGRKQDETLSVLGNPAIPVDPANPYSLRPGDTDAVFSPLPKNPRDFEEDGEEELMDDDVPDLGCMHYKRNVKVQCFDCQRWFPCRHCHDQSHDLPFPHNLNRKRTQNMLCMLCETPQPAAEVCINCGQYSAYYFCPKCKLWDNDSNKRIYHCDDCGICRVGEGLGKDYVHCRRCNVCISISTSAAHPCIERATEGNCPLCLVQLFESRTSVVSLPCGHYMHGDCYKDLMAVTYKCPVCSKSAVNMELQWKKLDDEIATQPMPEDEELDRVLSHASEGPVEPTEAQTTTTAASEPRPRRPREVWVGCNDCGGRSWTPFHWLGLKCQKCDSYNTNQMAPTAVHETEAERLMRQQQTIHRHDFSGNAVLRDAGIGVEEDETSTEQTLEVPESPSQQPTSPRLASGAQSPGRYFVHTEPPRRPSFTTTRFSAPSMPNLPTLPDLPRMPNLPTLQHVRDNLPNVELPRFAMFDSLSRSLSPMRYYLRVLERNDVDEDLDGRPMSVQSDPTQGESKLRSVSSGTTEGEVLWDEDERDLSPEGMDEDEDGVESAGDADMVDETEEEEEEDDEEMVTTAVAGKAEGRIEGKRRGLDLELIGHR